MKHLKYLLLLLLTACATSKKPTPVVFGTFKNAATDAPNDAYFQLWDKMFANSRSYDQWKDADVKISVINNRKMLAELYSHDTLLDKRIVRLRTADSTLLTHRQVHFDLAFGPLLWVLWTDKVRFVKSNDHDSVHVIYRKGAAAFLVIMPVGGADHGGDNWYRKTPVAAQ